MFRHADPDRDGALDTTIVAHEWGHYLHLRLADCGSPQCFAMSEGWADFVALHTMARETDNLDGTYAVGVYSLRGLVPDSGYFGIRRFPYSVDFTRNALTLRHISNIEPLPSTMPRNPAVGGPNAEVHNAGEVWASMLWEGYVALQQSRRPGQDFDRVRRRMADYIVAGLQLTPRNATFTEQRDTILAAAAAAGPDEHAAEQAFSTAGRDLPILADAFARRGAGTCAVSPARDSVTFAGVTEGYDLRPRFAIGRVMIGENPTACDRDGYLDGGERGKVLVTVLNGGPVELTNMSITVTSPSAGISFPHGNSAIVPRVGPLAASEVAIEIALDPSMTGIGRLEFTAAVQNADACQPVATRTRYEWINVDEVAAASTVDTVESRSTAWSPTGPNAADIWSRAQVASFEHAWLGIDSGSSSDTHLQSPALDVSATQPFVMTFDYRHSFEKSDANYDGGVIEISRNGGPWQDVSAYASPGYGGTLFMGSGNPLAGRSALVGTNASWPARNTLSLNFGTAFAGESVRVRFRIGTDAAVSNYGWELDNLSFQGITNQPFSALVAETNQCRAR
jgi:hypothetical protein